MTAFYRIINKSACRLVELDICTAIAAGDTRAKYKTMLALSEVDVVREDGVRVGLVTILLLRDKLRCFENTQGWKTRVENDHDSEKQSLLF
jgi:hypothetical protein